MASRSRQFAPGTIHHVFNRGSQKMQLFFTPKDYTRFLLKMQEYKERYPVEVLAYCVMPNHFHFLLREPINDPKGQQARPLGSNIADFLHVLQTAYSKYFQALHPDYSGRIFQGTYKSKLVDQDSYLLPLMAYIHDNPVRNKLVIKPENWSYSSYLHLIGVRDDGITTSDPLLSDMEHKKIYESFIHTRKTKSVALAPYLF